MRIKVHEMLIGVVCSAALLAASPSDSPVADAAMRGDVEALRALVKSGADVNAPQGDGTTALHWAAENGDVPMAQMLIYAGANVHAVTRIGAYTPLHLASRVGHASVITTLLKAGSDLNAATSSGGAVPLHFAAASGKADAVQILLDHGAKVDVREPVRGQTPLIFAASYNRLAVVKTLIAAGAEVALRTLMEDSAAVRSADRGARTRRNAVLGAFRSRDEARKQGYGPAEVQAAVRAGRSKVPVVDTGPVEEEEIDMDEVRFGETEGFGGLSALLHAVREGHEEVVFALLDAGADIGEIGTGENLNTVLLAIINGHFDLAQHLLERGADPSYASNSGDTALYAVLDSHWAVKSNGRPRQRESEQDETTYLAMMEWLLEKGVDVNVRLKNSPPYEARGYGSVNVRGATPFWRAAYATDVAAMRLLLAYGADPTMSASVGGGGRNGGGGRGGGRGTNPNQQQQARAAAQRGGNQRGGNQRGRRGQAQAGRGGNLAQALASGRGGNRFAGRRRGEPAPRTNQQPPAQEDQQPPAREERPELQTVGIGGGRAGGRGGRGETRDDTRGEGVPPIIASSGVGYGQGFAANSHRHVPDGWLPSLQFLVEELGADVNTRDLNGYTPLHHSAARGDNKVIMYLVDQGADVTALSGRGQTTADMANQPSSRLQIFPETIALLESLGSRNTKAEAKAKADFEEMVANVTLENRAAALAGTVVDTKAQAMSFLEGADRYPGGQSAVQYLTWVLLEGRDAEARAMAAETLMFDHKYNPDLEKVAQKIHALDALPPEKAQEFNQALLNSPHAIVSAWARYHDIKDVLRDPRADEQQKLEAQKVADEIVEAHANTLLARSILGPKFAAENLNIGQESPDIVGDDLDGESFYLSDYRQKVVVLEFWGDDAGTGYEHARALTEKFAEQPFALIGVNSDTDKDLAKARLETEGLTWRSFWNGPMGAAGPISAEWNIHAWPMTFVIDHKGVIRFKDVHGEALTEAVEKLIAEIEDK